MPEEELTANKMSAEELSPLPSTPPDITDSTAPPPPPVENQVAPLLHGSSLRSGLAPAAEEVGAVGPKKERKKTMRAWLMVVATLVAAAAYQSGLSPPGGFWQDNLAPSPGSAAGGAAVKGHIAGYPVLEDTDEFRYKLFYVFNTGAFAWSVVIILMLMREAFFHQEVNLNVLRGFVVSAVFNLTAAFGVGINRRVADTVVFFFVLGVFVVCVAVEVWRKGRRLAKRRLRGDVESHGRGPESSRSDVGV